MTLALCCVCLQEQGSRRLPGQCWLQGCAGSIQTGGLHVRRNGQKVFRLAREKMDFGHPPSKKGEAPLWISVVRE
jgi:hypothetical protein